MNRKSKEGITLIALVITIIVLLILAGISISMLSGDNSILNQAGRARDETERTINEEQTKIAAMEASTNLEGTVFKGVKIPAGYAPTKKDGESTIDEGLVIIDSNLNEYVWIEVPKDITEAAENEAEIYSALREYCSKDKSNGILIESTGNDRNRTTCNNLDVWYDGCGLNEAEYNMTKSKMLNSIKDNGGFWIGRYEAGIEGSDKDINLARQSHTDITSSSPKVVSKPNSIPYNWVSCSEAQKLASEVINNKHYISSLMFGIQWDLVLKYLNNYGIMKDLLITDSTEWGNYYIEYNLVQNIVHGYKGILSSNNRLEGSKIERRYIHIADGIALSTGATERNMKKNIYDLAGNMAEWTLERSSKSSRPCVYRGGSFSGVNASPVSYRGTAGISEDYIFINSRFPCINFLKFKI